jgi:hypothetical protein
LPACHIFDLFANYDRNENMKLDFNCLLSDFSTTCGAS